MVVLPFSKLNAQQNKPVKILFLLDGSSSMLDNWQTGKQRFKIAGEIINTIVDSIAKINPDVQFGLRVFGHQHTVQEQNCYDTKMEVPFSNENRAQLKTRLQYISPRGVSPIAYSLQVTAEENFVNSDRNAYSIILLTDGGESCGGNICEVIQKLINEKVAFKPYILSLYESELLKKDYECFGKYLSVAQPNQIAPAVKTILDDNRLMYEKNNGNLAQLKQEQKPVEKPVVKKDTLPEVKAPETPVVKKTEPEVVPEPKRELMPRISGNKKTRLLPIPFKKKTSYAKILKVANPNPNFVFVEEEEVVPARIVMASIAPKNKSFGLRRINNIWVFEEAKPSKVIAKAVKFSFVEEPEVPKVSQTTTAPPQKPVAPKPAPANNKQEDAPVTIKKVQSEDTKVLVYFTDGKGKYYKTEPKIDFVDVKTNKVVQSNYRLVDRNTGVPDAIKIPAGTYRITRPGSSFRSKTFTIEEHTTGRIDVVISKGSIVFRYPSSPNRPVVEYFASIQNSVEKGPLVRQRCDEVLEYEPGIYHIEINTLPTLVLTLPDLKFGEVNIVDIKEPGTVSVKGSLRGKVQLWYQRGTKYEPFYDLVLNGNPEAQKLNLQPGAYVVYYFKDGKEQQSKFYIKSKEETILNL
ncbi:MAG TPA: VWA domain-containing protein [Edaphocola sp.]|nr:VWA domain-containing protein [Edaphocola sp.]